MLVPEVSVNAQWAFATTRANVAHVDYLRDIGMLIIGPLAAPTLLVI